MLQRWEQRGGLLGLQVGFSTESKATAPRAWAVTGPRNQPGGPICHPGWTENSVRGGGEVVGERLSFGTFENRQMHAFHSDSGSSLLLPSEPGCVI